MGVIEMAGLRKRYGRRRRRSTVALDGVDVVVPEGGVFAVLGPNGAGKTTALRCLLNLVRPTAGRCRLLGVDPQTGFHRVQRRVGALGEAQALFPAFSGRRNLAHLARLYRLPVARVDEVLGRLGLADRAGDAVGTYSLGMRQRLGIAAALLKDPELLILDEPANGLDPEGVVEIRNLLRRLGDEGRTVFLSSHQLAEVQHVADSVAVLARGRCVAAGPLAAVLAAAGGSGLLVRIADAPRALAVLQAEGWEARSDGVEGIHVALPPEAAPSVARVLAGHGLYPRELRPAAANLEEAYLRIIGQGGTDG